MVLHVLSDDKFTNYVINQFSDSRMNSDIVVIPSGGEHKITKRDNVRIINYPSKEFSELLHQLKKYSGVVLHGLFWPYMEDIIKNAPQYLKIAWYFWGGEIYSHKNIMMSFLAPITKILYKLHSYKKNKDYTKNWQLPIELYKRIDYCLTAELEEYEFAKKYTESDMDFVWYTCYSLEETIGELINSRIKGENVLFCNSAAVETNIFDATLRLSMPSYRKHLKNKEVIVPLSYGYKWIKNLMLKIGPIFFYKFKPIVEFLPREEYNKMMLNCSTLILPYYSPAGQGNIITALWLGMRVYLSNKSIALTFFKRIGVTIFSIEDDFKLYGTSPISNEVVEHNRNILVNIYSKAKVDECCKNLIRILEN